MTVLPQLLADHFNDPYHRGECDRATHAGQAACPQTGCQLCVELRIDAEGIVEEAGFDSQGCAACEALASVLVERIEGCARTQLLPRALPDFLQQIELEDWEPTPCANLPLVALQQALNGPLEAIDGDLADGSQFGGPSLREEC